MGEVTVMALQFRSRVRFAALLAVTLESPGKLPFVCGGLFVPFRPVRSLRCSRGFNLPKFEEGREKFTEEDVTWWELKTIHCAV